MAFKCILLISLAIALVSTDERSEGKRLIKYNLKKPAKWMTLEELDQLLGGQKYGFADLTRSGVDDTMTHAEGRSQDAEYNYPDHPTQKEMVTKLISGLDKDHIIAHVQRLSKFHSRNPREYYGASEAEGWIISEIKAMLNVYKGGPHSIRFIADLGYEDPTFEKYKQQNIIVKLDGQDSTLKEEIIILGAHYDTMIGAASQWNTEDARTKKAPGADDNATGCAVLLEVLRLFVESRITLKHTVEFHFYTDKELGQLGSTDVVYTYVEEKLYVKGMLNFDSVGYGQNGNSITFMDKDSKDNGIRATNKALTIFVKMLVKEYTQDLAIKELELSEGESIYSDHYSWHKKGYPAAFASEWEQTPYVWTSEDTIQTVNFKQVNEFAKVGVAFIVELGEPSTSAAKPRLERMTVEIILIWFGILYFLNL